ncbi:MAG: class I SAM-dependent methyltransferase [Candidatus Eisenbacteria bacterium]|uniref:Class I SAM-dependent methyltransferase n=1 Tax=Eiseniibacteriota bacterium TaxID=2212470 RepID=A0A538TPE6_UNCEI|nr:MAG: class I SAM-dependent methyltransferase [Candidatus Eisenbacteria bacterium]
MPTSEHWQIPHVLDALVAERPDTLLDVGAGYGKYGCLAREYASPSRVDAVDVVAPRFPCYDHCYLGDLRRLDTLLPADAPRYDLALLIDVIEHLEKQEGHRLVGELLGRARRVLIATPCGFRAQEVAGKPFETHRSGWLPWDFWGRYRVHRLRVFAGHRTRFLRRPRLWQILALVSGR